MYRTASFLLTSFNIQQVAACLHSRLLCRCYLGRFFKRLYKKVVSKESFMLKTFFKY